MKSKALKALKVLKVKKKVNINKNLFKNNKETTTNITN